MRLQMAIIMPYHSVINNSLNAEIYKYVNVMEIEEGIISV